jgi:hypothetical protein
MDNTCVNTDRELYREPDVDGSGDYYSDSLHVTEGGNIGINVGGFVIVRPLAEWHRQASPRAQQIDLSNLPICKDGQTADYVIGNTNGGLTVHAQVGTDEPQFGDTAQEALDLAIAVFIASKY